jgi:hypothetical protein
MRFSVTRDFDADPAAVAAVLLDPSFHEALELADLGPPELVGHTPTSIALHYHYVGSLDPIAKKLLSGNKLSWVQTIELDPAEGRGTLSINADASDRLTADAAITLTGATTLAIAGDLHVRVPMIGGSAEKRIVPGVVTRLNTTADAIAQRLTRD